MRRLILALALWFIVTGSLHGQQTPDRIQVTDHAGWRPRDSQGEVVYQDKLWIFGGWLSSYAAPPRDAWDSTDGKTWMLVQDTPPWKHSDLSMSIVFDDKMWFLGGWYNGRLEGHSASNEGWSSTDGENWEQATANAGWTPRIPK